MSSAWLLEDGNAYKVFSRLEDIQKGVFLICGVSKELKIKENITLLERVGGIPFAMKRTT